MYLKLSTKYCNFGIKNSRRAWHVVPAQEVETKKKKRKKDNEKVTKRRSVTRPLVMYLTDNWPGTITRLVPRFVT